MDTNTNIAVVEGWSAVEWEYPTGGRRWVEVHHFCLKAYLDAAITGVLSDLDDVAKDYAEAWGLRCDHCGGIA